MLGQTGDLIKICKTILLKTKSAIIIQVVYQEVIKGDASLEEKMFSKN